MSRFNEKQSQPSSTPSQATFRLDAIPRLEHHQNYSDAMKLVGKKKTMKNALKRSVNRRKTTGAFQQQPPEKIVEPSIIDGKIKPQSTFSIKKVTDARIVEMNQLESSERIMINSSATGAPGFSQPKQSAQLQIPDQEQVLSQEQMRSTFENQPQMLSGRIQVDHVNLSTSIQQDLPPGSTFHVVNNSIDEPAGLDDSLAVDTADLLKRHQQADNKPPASQHQRQGSQMSVSVFENMIKTRKEVRIHHRDKKSSGLQIPSMNRNRSSQLHQLSQRDSVHQSSLKTIYNQQQQQQIHQQSQQTVAGGTDSMVNLSQDSIGKQQQQLVSYTINRIPRDASTGRFAGLNLPKRTAHFLPRIKNQSRIGSKDNNFLLTPARYTVFHPEDKKRGRSTAGQQLINPNKKQSINSDMEIVTTPNLHFLQNQKLVNTQGNHFNFTNTTKSGNIGAGQHFRQVSTTNLELGVKHSSTNEGQSQHLALNDRGKFNEQKSSGKEASSLEAQGYAQGNLEAMRRNTTLEPLRQVAVGFGKLEQSSDENRAESKAEKSIKTSRSVTFLNQAPPDQSRNAFQPNFTNNSDFETIQEFNKQQHYLPKRTIQLQPYRSDARDQVGPQETTQPIKTLDMRMQLNKSSSTHQLRRLKDDRGIDLFDKLHVHKLQQFSNIKSGAYLDRVISQHYLERFRAREPEQRAVNISLSEKRNSVQQTQALDHQLIPQDLYQISEQPKTLQSSLILPLNKVQGSVTVDSALKSERTQQKDKKIYGNLITSKQNLKSTALFSMDSDRKRSQQGINRSMMESVNDNSKLIASSREMRTMKNESDNLNDSPLNSILLNPIKKKKKVTAPLQRSLVSSRLPGKAGGSQLEVGVKLKSIKQIRKEAKAGTPELSKPHTERNHTKSTITQTTNMTSKMNQKSKFLNKIIESNTKYHKDGGHKHSSKSRRSPGRKSVKDEGGSGGQEASRVEELNLNLNDKQDSHDSELDDGLDEFAALDQKTLDVSAAIDQLFNFETKGIKNKKELLKKVLKVRFEIQQIRTIDSEEDMRLHIQETVDKFIESNQRSLFLAKQPIDEVNVGQKIEQLRASLVSIIYQMNESLRNGPDNHDSYPIIQPQMIKIAEQRKMDLALKMQNKVKETMVKNELKNQFNKIVSKVPDANFLQFESKSGNLSLGSNTERQSTVQFDNSNRSLDFKSMNKRMLANQEGAHQRRESTLQPSSSNQRHQRRDSTFQAAVQHVEGMTQDENDGTRGATLSKIQQNQNQPQQREAMTPRSQPEKALVQKPRRIFDPRHGEPIFVVPGLIPLLYKIPIKSIVAPLIIRFVYFKEDHPNFNSQSSDLQVFLSETELKPHMTYKMRMEQEQQQQSRSTMQPFMRGSKTQGFEPQKRLVDLEKLVMFRQQPKEITFNPQVQPKSKPGMLLATKSKTKVLKFHSQFLYLALLSEIGGFKVQVQVNFKEQLDDEEESQQKQNVANKGRSAFANYQEKKDMIEKEVNAMNLDPYYQSQLLQNKFDAQKRILEARSKEFGSALNKARLIKRKEKLEAERSRSSENRSKQEEASIRLDNVDPQTSRTHQRFSMPKAFSPTTSSVYQSTYGI